MQVDKLRIEREERARAGAPTPPMPIAPPEPVDTRHVLQPVERGENPDSPDNQPEKESDDGGADAGGKKCGDKSSNGDEKDQDGKKKDEAEQVNETFIYVEEKSQLLFRRVISIIDSTSTLYVGFYTCCKRLVWFKPACWQHH